MHFRRSGVEVLDQCFFVKLNISRAWIDNAGVLVIRLCRLGVLATGGFNTTSLFAEKIALILCSTTLFANPHRHNLVVHPNGRRAEFFSSFNQSSVLCNTSCWRLVHVTGLHPTVSWRLLVPHSSCGRFYKLFSCCYSFWFSPMSFLIVSDISVLLVVRVVRFVTKSSKTYFSLVPIVAILSKYPSRAARPIGVFFPRCHFP